MTTAADPTPVAGEPQTEAGKALVEWAENADPKQVHIWREHAVLIEAEAQRLTVERIAAKIERQISDPISREHYPEAVSVYQNALGLVYEELDREQIEAVALNRVAQEETRA